MNCWNVYRWPVGYKMTLYNHLGSFSNNKFLDTLEKVSRFTSDFFSFNLLSTEHWWCPNNCFILHFMQRRVLAFGIYQKKTCKRLFRKVSMMAELLFLILTAFPICVPPLLQNVDSQWSDYGNFKRKAHYLILLLSDNQRSSYDLIDQSMQG